MISKGFAKTVVVIGISAIAFMTWSSLGRPTSIAEARFLRALSTQDKTGELVLGKLMPGSWETVCDAPGYGGDFYLDQYKRTYPATGDMQHGAWGLVFIEPDGSFSSASGNCKSSGVMIDLNGCMPRTEAVARRHGGVGTCPTFGG